VSNGCAGKADFAGAHLKNLDGKGRNNCSLLQ
jgi:hypothetical protein